MDEDLFLEGTTLLTEHLKYTPLSLIDDIINAVNGYIYQSVNSLEAGLLSTQPERLGFKGNRPQDNQLDNVPEYTDAKQEIEEGLHKLETLLSATVDKNFDKFEIYVLRNILAVPEDLTRWVQLAHYKGITYPPNETVPTIEELSALRQRLMASRTISRRLASEANQNEVVLKQLRDLLNPKPEDDGVANVSFLTSAMSGQSFSGQQPLTANTKFTLSHLPSLKTSIAELKEKAATLQQTQPSLDTARDEAREERRRYIVQTTKAHLDRNGQSGSSNSQPFSGRQPTTDEVESLEKVSRLFNPP